jgi:hypothetical protein
MNSEDKRSSVGQREQASHTARSEHQGHMAENQRGNRSETASLSDGSLGASATLIGLGALIKPELLGGMLLGAGAVYAARNLPLVSGVLRPIISTVVKAGYAAAVKANEVIAEATEDVQDMVAEVRSEYQESSSSRRE